MPNDQTNTDDPKLDNLNKCVVFAHWVAGTCYPTMDGEKGHGKSTDQMEALFRFSVTGHFGSDEY